MREITDHVVNPANDKLKILVTDAQGAGGASHRYVIGPMSAERNASFAGEEPSGECCILFQNGTIPETGVNGVTHEALLAIVADRLRSFQAGPYSCDENARALVHVESAQRALQERTRARMARGVEGTHAV